MIRGRCRQLGHLSMLNHCNDTCHRTASPFEGIATERIRQIQNRPRGHNRAQFAKLEIQSSQAQSARRSPRRDQIRLTSARSSHEQMEAHESKAIENCEHGSFCGAKRVKHVERTNGQLQALCEGQIRLRYLTTAPARKSCRAVSSIRSPQASFERHSCGMAEAP